MAARLENGVDSSEIFQLALEQLLTLVPARRALIVTREPLRVRAARGIDPATVWTCGTISLEILNEVGQKGQPLLLDDAGRDPVFGERSSVVLAGLKSVLCAPFRGPSGSVAGLLYADNQEESAAFRYSDLGRVMQLVGRLEGSLARVRQEVHPVAPTPPSVGPRPDFGQRPQKIAAAEPPAEPKAWPGLSKAPSDRARAVFLRSLAAMVAAGVPLPRALDMLARQGDEPLLAQAASHLSRRISAGNSLSQAMRSAGTAFTPFQQQLVRVGESTGSLPLILERLATYEEQRAALSARLRSALTYPFFLMAGCTVMLVLGPPYLFGSLLDLLREYDVKPNPLTGAIMSISSLVRSPTMPLVLLLGLATLAALAREWQRRTELRRAWQRALLELPVLGRVVRAATVARFSRALALQLEAGISVTKALPEAASTDLLLQAHSNIALQELIEGQGVVAALARFTVLPPAFLAVAEVGVETGRLPELLSWLARGAEEELEYAVDTLTSLCEPLVMLIMGGAIGLMLIGTLLPMVEVLQKL